MKRSERKRGGKSSTRGIFGDHVAVNVTSDRSGSKDLTVATMGRIAKKKTLTMPSVIGFAKNQFYVPMVMLAIKDL